MSASRFLKRGVVCSITMMLSTLCAAESYYVSSQGSDSASGKTTASPFKSLEKAFSKLKNDDELYLQRGNVWKPSTSLRVAVANVTIGAYGEGARPVIDGQKKVPSLGSYSGLIHMTGDNAKIRDVVLTNSGGMGLRFYEVTGALAENVKVGWTYRHAIQAIRSNNVTFKNCESVHSAAQFIDPNRPKGGWPHALSLNGSKDVIVEGCVVHEGWGEGISVSRGGQRLVFRDNVIYGMRAVGIYIDNGRDVEISRNIVLGTTDVAFQRNASGYAGPGIYISNETENAGIEPPRDIKIYNNLVANTQVGIIFGGQPADFKGVKVAHNTFVDNKVQFSTNTQEFSGSGNIFAHNIFLSTDATSSDVAKSLTRSSVVWHNNYWSKAPHAAMRSPGDVYGGAKLTKMAGWKKIKPVPDVSAVDFKPRADSTTNGAGRKISDANVGEDYNNEARGRVVDLGALNYSPSQVAAKPSSPNSVSIR